jgi:hypothetical protein
MQVNREDVNDKHLEAVYVVDHLRPEEISESSDRFLKFVRETPELSFINKFTLKEFINGVRDRYSSTAWDHRTGHLHGED